MKEHVTVVPADNLILVNKSPLTFPFNAPPAMHALQWNMGIGHIEWEGDANQHLEKQDYESHVAPFVILWEAEKARKEQEEQATPDAGEDAGTGNTPVNTQEPYDLQNSGEA